MEIKLIVRKILFLSILTGSINLQAQAPAPESVESEDDIKNAANIKLVLEYMFETTALDSNFRGLLLYPNIKQIKQDTEIEKLYNEAQDCLYDFSKKVVKLSHDYKSRAELITQHMREENSNIIAAAYCTKEEE